MIRKKKPKLHQQKGNYAFIDSQNLNLGTQKVGFKMDWSKFLAMLQNKYHVKKAFLFIGYMPEYEQMYNQLHELGYLIVLKPTSEVTHVTKEGDDHNTHSKTDDKEQRPAIKGNIDAELVLYAMKEMPHYDKAIIVSGDGDFLCLVEYLHEQGKLLHLMTPNWQYSKLLKTYEDYIIRLDNLRKQLAYRDRVRSVTMKRKNTQTNKP